MAATEIDVLEESTRAHGASFPVVRMRRLRANARIRNLVRENTLTVNDMVLPLFIEAGNNIKKHIDAMPGQYRLSLDNLKTEIEEIVHLKIPAVMLFGIPAHKDDVGSDSLSSEGIIQQATRLIKQWAPELLVMTDVCFCEYTSHGHCGIVHQDENQHFIVDNDKTLALLAKQAVSHAQAGSDVVVPSGMMDGGVQAIRCALDKAGFSHILILSHTTKYASSLYGPFREAADGAPQFGDRKTYQMDPANGNRGLREAELDIAEGADILMIKPALAYLDVIYRIKQRYPGVPISAYQVSGEYAMIKAAAQNGWLDETKVMMESLLAIKRAGADIIVSYFAKDLAKAL